MTILRGVLPALALTAACAMPPEGTDEQDLANFDAAVASVGCDLRTESEYLAVELQTGLKVVTGGHGLIEQGAGGLQC